MRYYKTLHSFYTSKEWADLKKQIRNERLNKNGETVDEYTGKPIYGNDVVFHHKEPLTMQNVNDWNISLNANNIMIVSHKSHNEIHARFSHFQRKVYLIVGSPLSGKTSFVERAASKEDIIFDFDKIWSSISINEPHIKNPRLKPIAFALRECLLDQIKMRSGKWINAWIITTEPFVMNRKRLIDSLGIDEVIVMDATRESCLERLHQFPDGRNIEEYEQYINNFYDNYQEEEIIE